MEIKNIGNVRLLEEWPCHLDIVTESHESIMASVQLIQHKGAKYDTQSVVVLEKEGVIGLWVSGKSWAKLPEWWEDASILFEHYQAGLDADGERVAGRTRAGG